MSDTLIQLAAAKFGSLTETERRFYSGVAEGKFADFSSTVPAENDPVGADAWPAARVLAAERIAWLATDAAASKCLTHRGIGVKGVRIDGRLDLQAANILFPLYLDRCALPAGISLLGAEIHSLNMAGCRTGRISADGMQVEAGVFFRAGFHATGRVRLIGAKIGGNLDCNGGLFAGTDDEALLCDSVKVAGSVLLNQQFRADGEVRLLGAWIGGNLSCDAGRFLHPGKDALIADRIHVEGNVFLSDGFTAQGRTAFPTARIDGFFVWHRVNQPQDTVLDLRSAKIGTLWFGRESWPQSGKLFLHGLAYDTLDDRSELDAATWVQWLQLQPAKPFRPQPYEQLAGVLRRNGQDADAKDVLYAKERDRARRTELSWSQFPWYRIFGPLIGFGFKPWRAFWLSVAVVMFGSVMFGIGNSHDLMRPVKAEGFIGPIGSQVVSPNYPTLNVFMYSLDTFTPLISLDQADYWIPAANRGAEWNVGPVTFTSGGLLRAYMWLHIILGWTLSTLLFVGLTGAIPGV